MGSGWGYGGGSETRLVLRRKGWDQAGIMGKELGQDWDYELGAKRRPGL